MTKVIVIESDKTKVDFSRFRQGMINSFEGACNADGSFKKGWQPPGQWYVRVNASGKYTVVHNQNRLDYALSCSLLKDTHGTIKSSNLTDVSFDLDITSNGEPVLLPFRFHITFTVKKDG